MKKYDSYKECDLAWVKFIPSHWTIKSLKYGVENRNSIRIPLSSEVRGEMESKVYDYYGASGVIDKVEDYLFEEDLILLGEDGANLLTRSKRLAFIASGKYWVNNHAHIFKPKKENINYLVELLESLDYQIYVSGSAQPKLTAEALMSIKIISPPLEEQALIAKYLNHKTTQIDNLIQKKERLIELLQEERTAVINQAVTKGLDPNAPMKDSGIEWLGEIPAHWSEARVKNIVNIIGRIGFRGYTTADLVEKGEGAISLSPSNIKNHILNIDDCTYLSWEKYNESPEIKIYRNDIILVKTGSTIGKTAIIPADTPEMTLNPQLVVFKEIKLEPLFLYYVMISDYFQGYFNVYTAGGSTPAISQEKINNFKITYPDLEEQKEISEYICKKEFEIKQIINSAKQEIELLKEYKTALISEVVTGKVDVRGEIKN